MFFTERTNFLNDFEKKLSFFTERMIFFEQTIKLRTNETNVFERLIKMGRSQKLNERNEKVERSHLYL